MPIDLEAIEARAKAQGDFWTELRSQVRRDRADLLVEVRRLRGENDALWETDALHRRSKECKDVALKEAQIWMNGCDVVAGGMIPDKSDVLAEITAALEADKEPSS